MCFYHLPNSLLIFPICRYCSDGEVLGTTCSRKWNSSTVLGANKSSLYGAPSTCSRILHYTCSLRVSEFLLFICYLYHRNLIVILFWSFDECCNTSALFETLKYFIINAYKESFIISFRIPIHTWHTKRKIKVKELSK